MVSTQPAPLQQALQQALQGQPQSAAPLARLRPA